MRFFVDPVDSVAVENQLDELMKPRYPLERFNLMTYIGRQYFFAAMRKRYGGKDGWPPEVLARWEERPASIKRHKKVADPDDLDLSNSRERHNFHTRMYNRYGGIQHWPEKWRDKWEATRAPGPERPDIPRPEGCIQTVWNPRIVRRGDDWTVVDDYGKVFFTGCRREWCERYIELFGGQS